MMRAQSHVVGVALLLGLTVVALGGLTLVVGSIVDAGTASADATRVADELDTALRPVETTGPRTRQVHFTDGSLHTVHRDLCLLENGSVVEGYGVGALVFETGDRRVAFLAGAVVRGQGDGAWLASDPPITASERTAVLVAGVPRLEAGDLAVGAGRSAAVRLRTNVSHRRTDLGRGEYGVAIETSTPRPFARYFSDQNASVTVRDMDGDGVPSVVATYADRRRGYLVVHNLSLEVHGG
jgi:hypothetical protein